MTRTSLLLVSLAVALVGGCFLNHDNPPLPPLEVDVAIAGVSLGEDCPESVGSRVAGDCAAEPGLIDDGCGSFCQQSSVTFSIQAVGDRSSRFEVVRATLLSADGAELQELSTTNAQIFTGESYTSWDESIPAPSDLTVLYDVNGIDWSTVEDPYSRTFRLRLVVEVDGVARTLTSEEATREAPIVT